MDKLEIEAVQIIPAKRPWVGVGDQHRHPDGTIKFDLNVHQSQPTEWLELFFGIPLLAFVFGCGLIAWAAMAYGIYALVVYLIS